ncbi:MAG: hypothetical protein LWX56_02235, partial [Ignavibacteria bacterium]|nr:hypothetical protein [Ignavibacteria bacterium]
LKDITFVNKNTGYICGAGGEIFKTTGAGSTWKKLETKVFSGLVSILFLDPQKGICVSNKGEILETDNGGEQWSIYPGNNYLSLNRLVKAAQSALYISGFNGLILKTNL